MACPRCGDICHCNAGVRMPRATQLRPRFEVDSDDSRASLLVDPEQYDASEERFSASLESPAAPAASFIPDEPGVEDDSYSDGRSVRASEPAPISAENDKTAFSPPSSDADSVPTNPPPNPDAWKQELAERLSSYRAKRKPRPPKYPSLSLDFEPPFPSTCGSGARTPDLRTSASIEDRAQNIPTDAPAQRVRVVPAEDVLSPPAVSSASGRLIEFPRFFGPEEPSPDQLAEPVCEQPRILDAPEVELPAPALGGIVLETEDESATEERPGFEVPLRSASIARRFFAAAIDAVVIIAAGVLFASIFLQLVKALPPLPHLLASASLVTGLLWAGYQYLLLTYAGTTPGLRVAKLQLTQFDGSPVLRARRRWRVLASLLSGVSLGLGFAWCFLDEDALCWHDRITRTHLIPLD